IPGEFMSRMYCSTKRSSAGKMLRYRPLVCATDSITKNRAAPAATAACALSDSNCRRVMCGDMDQGLPSTGIEGIRVLQLSAIGLNHGAAKAQRITKSVITLCLCVSVSLCLCGADVLRGRRARSPDVGRQAEFFHEPDEVPADVDLVPPQSESCR